MRRLIPLLFLSLMSTVSSAPPLEAYPAAEKGMVRHVLQLPAEKDESLYKVELILGKTVKTDAANSYFFGGLIEARSIEGWGYSYHILEKIGPMAGTLMAAPPEAPKVERFIAIGGDPYLIRYNSKLPVVVYAPQGVEVRYRLWRADADATAMEKG
ncbi:ecotin [Haloferula sp.]|uniref:ecotin n=1 Tax=Haloferula sp. TaxID=2497595 RepID=UPI003C77D73D